jgi:hypothetical protein
MRTTNALALPLLAVALAGCSSDPDPEPTLTVDTPGAFVAVDEGGPALTLQRTLDTITVENDRVIFLTVYDVAPRSWDEARDLSRLRGLPMSQELTVASMKAFPAGPHRVVWFRTLDDDERARVR